MPEDPAELDLARIMQSYSRQPMALLFPGDAAVRRVRGCNPGRLREPARCHPPSSISSQTTLELQLVRTPYAPPAPTRLASPRRELALHAQRRGEVQLASRLDPLAGSPLLLDRPMSPGIVALGLPR
jgi:hypothetical protein